MQSSKNLIAALKQFRASLDTLILVMSAEMSPAEVGPVEAVRQFRKDNPDATTADAIQALLPLGFNAGTIRTQMSRQKDEQVGSRQDHVVNPRTAKGRVYALARRKSGVALSEIVEEGISINLVAARALVYDLRREGRKMTLIRKGVYAA